MRVSGTRVRLATAEDISSIQSIAKQTWHTTYAGLIPVPVQNHLLSMWYSIKSLRDSLGRENSRFFVAEIGDKLVGFAQFALRGDGEGQLARIYVLPSFHGRGIGGLLLDNGLDWLKQKKTKKLRVIVERENRIGRRFYEAKGFHWLRDFEDEFRDETIGAFRQSSCEYSLKIDLG